VTRATSYQVSVREAVVLHAHRADQDLAGGGKNGGQHLLLLGVAVTRQR
jgi:hypothetical protein